MILLSFVCSFYPKLSILRSHGCTALMLTCASLEDLQKHCLSILHESSLSIKSRPGYAFSLGCDEWTASGFKGTINGYSALPSLKWISSSWMVVDNDANDKLNEMESELDRAAVAAAKSAGSQASDAAPMGMIRPPEDTSSPISSSSSHTSELKQSLKRHHERWDLHVMGHPCFDVPNLIITAKRYFRENDENHDDIVDILSIDYLNRVDMLQNISYFGM